MKFWPQNFEKCGVARSREKYIKYFKKSHPKFQFNKHAKVITKTGVDQPSKMRAGRVRGMGDLFDEMD